MQEEIYKENILDHYKHPHNFGTLDNATIKNREVNPLCGDELEITLLIKDKKVVDVKFSGKGCAISVAAGSMLTDEVKGKTIDEVKKFGKNEMLEMLGIKVGVVRMKCALLALKTLQKGLK